METTQQITRISGRRFSMLPVIRFRKAVRSASVPRRARYFYTALMLTTLLPFLIYLLPFVPYSILGLNMTGWAWSMMLAYTLFQLGPKKRPRFPIKFWLPWAAYLVGYLVYDFSVLGLQLTCQYLLPLLIGVVASSFVYNDNLLRWIFQRFFRLCLAVIGMFVFGYLFRGGYTPAAAATPMLLSVLVAFVAAAYYTRKENKFLIMYGALFLIPFIDLTRMGIAVFIAIFVFHFANRKVKMKIWGSLIGAGLVLVVFNSPGFQEKTFYGGSGTFADIELNYYESQRLNTSGRSTWYKVLEPGLERSPVFGNGPRADNEVLSIITGRRGGEAHNDYLSVAYNYGYFGLALLIAGFGLTFIKLRTMVKKEQSHLRYLLITSTMTLFFGFAMFMYTDNILKYTIYFPNYFFAMIGIAFAKYQSKADQTS